jgi:hypothetical protein
MVCEPIRVTTPYDRINLYRKLCSLEARLAGEDHIAGRHLNTHFDSIEADDLEELFSPPTADDIKGYLDSRFNYLSKF